MQLGPFCFNGLVFFQMTEQRHGWLLCEMFHSTSSGHYRNRRRKSAWVQHDPFGSNVKTEFWEPSCKGKDFCLNHLLRLNWRTQQDFAPETPKEFEVGFTSQPWCIHPSLIMFPAEAWKSKPYRSWKNKLIFLLIEIKWKILIPFQKHFFRQLYLGD